MLEIFFILTTDTIFKFFRGLFNFVISLLIICEFQFIFYSVIIIYSFKTFSSKPNFVFSIFLISFHGASLTVSLANITILCFV